MQEMSLQEVFGSTVSRDKWERVGFKKRAGVAVPLFSVYSRESLGIGDFADLRLAVDFCAASGNSILQLLPLNEMGPLFCPYDAISSSALEPLYISVRDLPALSRRPIADRVKSIRNAFPAGKSHVDYRLKQEKMRLLWDIFLQDTSIACQEFADFASWNAYWVHDYALFQVLKYHQQGRAWYDWEEQYRDRGSLAVALFRKEHEQEVAFYVWLQWLAFTQLKEAKEYAQAKGIFLKGDLPILISRDSADVWAHPGFFKLEFASGAPPDMYCAKGQRWGMPTYNWEKIAADNYRYVREKLTYSQNFYHILRIDHVVGLFRIWSIPFHEPLENQGLNGFFDPREEHLWGEHGRRLLSMMLGSTHMLLCAEDLGVIPRVCIDTLKELGIPGNDVQRWVKDWNRRHDFLGPDEYRLPSVAMLSTHDTTTWPAWWEYEAGTVDEGLFVRKCADRRIDFNSVKPRLFDASRSRHGRLRWQEAIGTVDTLVGILGKRKEEVGDFVELYENTYREKEKLWQHLKLAGPMREKCDAEIIRQALAITLDARAVFVIQLITDWLYLGGLLKGEPYSHRINFPGTVSDKNWSLTVPIALEDLVRHRACSSIKKMIAGSGRI